MRRKFTRWLTAVTAVCALAPTAEAGSGDKGYYVGLRLIGAYAEVDDVTGSQLFGTLQVKNDTDLTAGAGVVMGYRWKSLPIRSELEISHRFRFDFDTRDTGGANVVGYENNLGTTTGLVNVAYEYRNDTDFTPYAGGSIGWSQNHSVTDRGNLSTGADEELERRQHNFAWGAMLGVTWRMARNWDADLGYRFINLGRVDTGTANAGGRIEADEYIAHDVLVTVHYRF